MAVLTLISHFYNEEFLLPHWLTHHVRLFDHGVLIDYASTDRSLEICRALAPHWEVRPSQNSCFDAYAVDLEVMQIERGFDGWKMVLNTTEFLFHPDVRGYIASLESDEPDLGCVATRCAVMCDSSAECAGADTNRPMVLQKHYGYVDYGQQTRRLRFLHRFSDGRYHLGRHGTDHPARLRDDLLLLWFGFSPWVEQLKARKLQIQTRIPDHDKRAWRGKEHITTPAQLEEAFLNQKALSYDLFRDPVYYELYCRVEHALLGSERHSG